MSEKHIRRDECWYKDVCLADPIECPNCIKFLEMQYLMETSNLPKARQKPQVLYAPQEDVEAYNQLAEIKANIVDFVDSGSNLYITSATTGNGKTSWAIKLLLKYFDEIWSGNGFNVRGLFVHVPTFLVKAKDFKTKDAEFEHIKKYITSADLVVWDDIAGTTLSGYDYSQLLVSIDARFLACKANIFTGNLTTIDAIAEHLGHRLASRIYSTNTKIITLSGGDMR